MARLADSRLVHRARHRLRARISEHPGMYLPLASRKYRGASPRVIDATTEMVIDGYTRSASTFAVYALQLAQERPVKLAHHLHAPAQLIAGVRAELPALLVVREPSGAILSQLIREPDVAMRDALVAYCRFHECLRPYVDGLVVAEFSSVTHDFGTVVRRLNAKFGLSLCEFVHTPDAIALTRRMIEQRGSLAPHLLGFESGLVSRELAMRTAAELAHTEDAAGMREAWVPSPARAHKKEALVPEWQNPGLRRLRERAGRVYREFARLDPAWMTARSVGLGVGQVGA
jgi:hypothetical protein